MNTDTNRTKENAVTTDTTSKKFTDTKGFKIIDTITSIVDILLVVFILYQIISDIITYINTKEIFYMTLALGLTLFLIIFGIIWFMITRQFKLESRIEQLQEQLNEDEETNSEK